MLENFLNEYFNLKNIKKIIQIILTIIKNLKYVPIIISFILKDLFFLKKNFFPFL